MSRGRKHGGFNELKKRMARINVKEIKEVDEPNSSWRFARDRLNNVEVGV